MEYLRATASSRSPPEKLIRTFLKNSPKRSFFYKFREFFRTRTTFPLKNLCDFLWMESVYSVKMRLQNTSKTLPKIFNVCSFYMLKIISLTGRPHNLEFLPRVFPTYWLFLLMKNKENFSNEESCFAPDQQDILYSCPTLF